MVGTGGGIRTRMPLRARRFERRVSRQLHHPGTSDAASYYHRPPRTFPTRARARGQERFRNDTFAGKGGDGRRVVDPAQNPDGICLSVTEPPERVAIV